MYLIFFLQEWKDNEMKVAEKYFWVRALNVVACAHLWWEDSLF